jgi:hypothetical protein
MSILETKIVKCKRSHYKFLNVVCSCERTLEVMIYQL